MLFIVDLTASTGHTIRKKKKKIAFNDVRLFSYFGHLFTVSKDARASFTDFLIWAVFLNRFDLAKAIWQRTTLPVHSALVACQLYPQKKLFYTTLRLLYTDSLLILVPTKMYD